MEPSTLFIGFFLHFVDEGFISKNKTKNEHKKIFLKVFMIGLLVAFLGIPESNAFTSNGPKFEYKAKNNRIQLDTMYLGTMDDEVKLEIEFKNTGSAPLIVRKVDGCCGTRITEWTQRPLKPGEKGTIKVQFRVEPRPHKINLTVKAHTNDPDGVKKLKIKGLVSEQDVGSIILDKQG